MTFRELWRWMGWLNRAMLTVDVAVICFHFWWSWASFLFVVAVTAVTWRIAKREAWLRKRGAELDMWPLDLDADK